MLDERKKTNQLLDKKPELSTSHTVLVIDNSGSMLGKKNNVHLYRDSQNAAFSMAALEFVAEQLFNNTAVNSDLVSLVKFSSYASVEICRQPIGWLVYNELLSHRNIDRFVDRQSAPFHDSLLGQSNYLPALAKAEEVLIDSYHEKCALSLFFFSDGGATDHLHSGKSKYESKQLLCEKISAMAAKFGEAFTVRMVGLGNHWDDFSFLEAMAKASSDAGAKGSFEFCNKTANSITNAISSLVTSTTETRTELQEGRRYGLTQRKDLLSEKDAGARKFDWNYSEIIEHYVYDRQARDFVHTPFLPSAAVESNPRQAAPRQNNPPPFLAINQNYIGKGAERAAFRCRLSDKKSVDGFIFDTMIAKETIHTERIDELIAFHKVFAETQDLANFLAGEFNKLLHGLPTFEPENTPQISFLSCSVLVLRDPKWPTGGRGVLVEPFLDTSRFRWTKWNDNNGAVEGKRQHIPLDVDFELKELRREEAFKISLAAISEEQVFQEDEESEDEYSEDDDIIYVESEHRKASVEESPVQYAKINPSDYLQAFTHFTYRYTHKRVMVCDLQGIFNTEAVPPTFELTDPAIHYDSTKGRRMVFGRTDKGRSGMNTFFRTHKCTKICAFLQLSAKNEKWKRDWRRDNNSSKPQKKSQSHEYLWSRIS
jgi:hypothetical protein